MYLNTIKTFLIILLSVGVSHTGIREYTPADIPVICQIMKNNWSQLTTLPHYDQKMMNDMLLSKRPFDPEHRNKTLHVIVYEVEDTVVGFATYFYANATTGHVELLAIAPPYQSKGYGKQLMDYMQHEFLDNNAQAIQLYVYPSNPKAIEFYKRLGFDVKLRALQHWLLNKLL